MKRKFIRVYLVLLFYAVSGLSVGSQVARLDRLITTGDTSPSFRNTVPATRHLLIQTKNLSNFDDLKEPLIFSYALRSDFVVQARAESYLWVGLRHRLNRDPSRLDLGESVAAFVHSFSTERVLCSNSSLSRSRRAESTVFKEFKVFIIARDRFHEFYKDGGEYLIFLEKISPEEKLWETYEVGRDVEFYRAVKGDLSIFGGNGLDDGPPKAIINVKSEIRAPLIKRIEAFCGALSPGKVSEKIRNLRVLAKSPDRELRENAEYAIRWFKGRK